MDLDFSFFGYSPLPKPTRSRLDCGADSKESKLKLRQRTRIKFSTSNQQSAESSAHVTREATASNVVPNDIRTIADDHAIDTASTLVQSTTGKCRTTEEQDISIALPFNSHISNENSISRVFKNDSFTAVNGKSVILLPKLIHSKASDKFLNNMSVIVISDSDSCSTSASSGKKFDPKKKHRPGELGIVIPETDSNSVSGSSTSGIPTTYVNSGTHISSNRRNVVIPETDSSHEESSFMLQNKKVINRHLEGKSKDTGYRNRKIIVSSSSSTSSTCSKSSKPSLTAVKERSKKTNVNARKRLVIPSSDSSDSRENRASTRKVTQAIVIESSDEDERISELALSQKIMSQNNADAAATVSTVNNVPLLTKSKKHDIEKWLIENVTCEDEVSTAGDLMNVHSSDTFPSSSLPHRKTGQSAGNSAEPNDDPDYAASSGSAENLLTQLYGSTWRSAKKTTIVSSSESDDEFDKLVTKYVDGTRPNIFATYRQVETRTKSPDFINDEDVSVNSPGFYQALLNSDSVHNKLTTDAASDFVTKTNRRLSFLHLGSDEDETEEILSTNIRNTFLLPSEQNKDSKPKKKPSKKKALPVVNATTAPHVFAIPAVLISSTKSNVKLPGKNEHLQFRSFLESLSEITPAPYCDPAALDFKKNFSKKKDELSRKLYTIFNRDIFERKLPDGMRIEWNARMKRTAGFCYNRREPGPTKEKVRSSRIELSTKVIDTPARLRDTLVHELCHAAVWIINGVQNGHGQYWKAWAAKAMRLFPELPPIARCHDYEIETKYTYKCTCCGYSIGRHSKSLDVLKKRCGYCYGTFELLINYKSKGGQSVATPKTPRNPTAFALFVKENYGSVKSNQVGLKHGEVMKLLGQQFAATKIAQTA